MTSSRRQLLVDALSLSNLLPLAIALYVPVFTRSAGRQTAREAPFVSTTSIIEARSERYG